jgi:ACS family sodium-dependent inorganic phosphate cotransporter
LASEAETEWSDGVAVGFKVEQQRRLGVGFTALLRTKPVWAICVAQYTGSWGFYGLLNWLPSFFKDAYHLEIAQLATFTLLPYLVQGGVGAGAGIVADALLSRGWPVKRVRRVLQTVGMLGPAACMVAAASPLTEGDPGAASAWITLGLGLNALTLAGVSVSHLDIAPKHAGVVFAAGNTSATVAGLLAVPLTGVVLQATGSWPLVFGITAAHYVVGAALFSLWVGDKPLPQDG